MIFNSVHIPEVSIILATYNRANIIGASIESVLRQTFSDWELIIVDDGSSDKTYEIVRDYLEESEKIKYQRHSHRKLPLTRNAGIRLSRGEYITFIDSDDIYLEDHILVRLKKMKGNPAVDLIHGGYQIIGNPFVPDKNDHTRLIHLDQCYVGGTFFGKRKVFNELGGFRDIPYSEDSDFMERALLRFEVERVFTPTYLYNRYTADSICNTF